MFETVLLIFAALLAWAYVFLILYILRIWNSQKEFLSSDIGVHSDIKLSILMAARNEAKNIAACLDSILSNENVPEVLIVNDHSEDNTVEIVGQYSSRGVRLLNLPEGSGGKKSALSYGLSHCSGDYVLQLDADVLVPADYINTLKNFIADTEADFIAAPVEIGSDGSLLESFQMLDYAGMMMVTQAGIVSGSWHIANGANMIYKRDMMKFEDNGMASGDDVFGIQYIRQQGGKLAFLKSKDCIARTQAISEFSELYQQRLRWSTKNKHMPGAKMLLMMSTVFAAHVMIFVYLALVIFSENTIFVNLLLHHTVLIFLIDYILLKTADRFFNLKEGMSSYLAAKSMHAIYISAIGILGIFVKNYDWKGRSLR